MLPYTHHKLQPIWPLSAKRLQHKHCVLEASIIESNTQACYKKNKQCFLQYVTESRSEEGSINAISRHILTLEVKDGERLIQPHECVQLLVARHSFDGLTTFNARLSFLFDPHTGIYKMLKPPQLEALINQLFPMFGVAGLALPSYLKARIAKLKII